MGQYTSQYHRRATLFSSEKIQEKKSFKRKNNRVRIRIT